MIGPRLPDEPQPVIDDRTLRQFAGLCIVIFGALFALSCYRNHGSPRAAAWVGLVLALLVGVPGLMDAGRIRPAFWAATVATRPIGHLMGKVVLAFIFFGLVTPLGWIFRLMGRDPLERRHVATRSYWVPISEPQDVRRYVHQYQKEGPLTRDHPTGVEIDHGTA
jgi:drug/metabolite transporter (DMT)-like permease